MIVLKPGGCNPKVVPPTHDNGRFGLCDLVLQGLSGPAVTGDPPSEAPGEPLASCDTAFSCLLQLSGRSGANEFRALHCRNVVNGETLSISRLIELAGDLGLEAEHTRLDWQHIQALGFSRPILVLLKNTNVIMLTGGGSGGTSEVAVWDPLDPYGQILAVPREDFERACTGHALIITGPPSTGVGTSPSLDLCWLTSAGLELLGKTSAKGQDPKLAVQRREDAGSHLKPAASRMPRQIDKAIAPAARDELVQVSRRIANERLRPDLPADAQLSITAFSPPATERWLPPLTHFCIAAAGILAAAGIATFLFRNSATYPVAAAITLAKEVWAVAAHSARPTDQAMQIDQAMQRVTASSIASVSPTGSAPIPTPPPAISAAVPRLTEGPSSPSPRSGRVEPSDEPIAPPVEPVAPSSAVASPRSGEADAAASSSKPGLATPGGAPATETAALPASTNGGRLTADEMASLLARGDTQLSIGDVASARLFYERAVDAGSGLAAIRLGETFDPLFLDRVPLNGVRGDPDMASLWYRRARDLGAGDAQVLLKTIGSK